MLLRTPGSVNAGNLLQTPVRSILYVDTVRSECINSLLFFPEVAFPEDKARKMALPVIGVGLKSH